MLLTFLWIYKHVSLQVKQLMLFGLIVALGGEILFSLVLGMYTYRLENLPIYVPFGHTLIYTSVYYLIKEPVIQEYKTEIIQVFYVLMIVYSTLWFLLGDDTFGFLCMLLILFLLKRYPFTKLFFLIMFFTIVYLELMGTYYQCWHWPLYLFDQFSWLQSSNPPSGISVFYFAFDAGCLWFYKRFNPTKWKRLKSFRRLKAKRDG